MTLNSIKMALISSFGLLGLKKIPVVLITGSKFSYFALDQALAPLSGFFSNTRASIAIYCLRTLLQTFITPMNGIWMLHIPSFAGTVALSSGSRLIKAAMPFACIIAFITHPIGSLSWLYTCYWLPPLLLGLFKVRTPLLQALSATLTTHAVGSVIWLYSHTTTPEFWHSLLSVVWYERLTFALCLTAGYYVIDMLKKMGKRGESLQEDSQQCFIIESDNLKEACS